MFVPNFIKNKPVRLVSAAVRELPCPQREKKKKTKLREDAENNSALLQRCT